MGDTPGCMPAARKGLRPKMPLDEPAVDVASPAMPIAARKGLSASGSFLSAAADEEDEEAAAAAEDDADAFFDSFADDFFSLSAALDELLFVVVVGVVVFAVVVGEDNPAMPFKLSELGIMPGKPKAAPGKPPRPIPSRDGLAKGFCIIIICICS